MLTKLCPFSKTRVAYVSTSASVFSLFHHTRKGSCNYLEMEVEGENTLTKHDAHGDDDDPPILSSRALEALKELLAEQNQTLTDSTSENGGSKVALVAEDWRLSQFWYDPLTAETVAEEVLTLCKSSNYRVACIACPTLYANLKKIDPNVTAQLLEYDKRFEQYGSDFKFYDYNQPEKLPSALKHAFQVVVADPSYLISDPSELLH